jgi:hypothetical protein
MIKTLALLAASFVAGHAASGTPASLVGVWVEVNGPGAALIAPCPDQSGQLCAIGLDRSNLKPPGQAQVCSAGWNRRAPADGRAAITMAAANCRQRCG